jgi:hypothetical protein
LARPGISKLLIRSIRFDFGAAPFSTMTRKKYDAVATVGEYTDKQTGEKKKQYANVGTVFENDDGKLSLKLDTIPVGPGWSGYIQFFEPKPRQDAMPEGRTQQRSMPPAPATVPKNDDDDDIPF